MSVIKSLACIKVNLSDVSEEMLSGAVRVPVSTEFFTEWELVTLMAVGHMHGVEGVICWTPESLREGAQRG